MKAKDYFVFTKRERSGIISLIVLVLVVIIIPKFYKSRTPVAETIPEVITGDTVIKEKKTAAYKKFDPPRINKKKIQPFEINSADTTAFIALPGIGSKLAARIVLFREELGGFYNIEQIREVYGLQDSV